MSVARMIRARLLPLAGVKRPVAPTPFLVNRVHSFRCRDGSIKSLEVDPGHTLARLIRAPDAHSSERGAGKGDRRCRLAFSLTDRGRGCPTEIRIRGGGCQSAASSRSRSAQKFPVCSCLRQHAEVAVAADPRRRHLGGEAVEQLQRRQDLRAGPARTLFGALVEQVLGIERAQPVQRERRTAVGGPASCAAVSWTRARRSNGSANVSFPQIDRQLSGRSGGGSGRTATDDNQTARGQTRRSQTGQERP